MNRVYFFSLITMTLITSVVRAQAGQFHPGPVIKAYGMIADVEGREALPENASFKISFDVAKQAELASVNRGFDTTARFINMHAAAGVKPENISLAVVIHGNAVNDVTNHEFYKSIKNNLKKQINGNDNIIKILQKHGVQFYVCGQSASYYGIKSTDLLPGVKMSLSAMTAHALLQQHGYTLNPF